MTNSIPLRFEILDPIKLPLVKKLYKAYYPSGRAKADEIIWVAMAEHKIAALLRLKTIEEDQLLTGMLVIPDMRQQGVGHALLSHCQEHVFDHQVYCLAYAHLEHYYAQHGFATIDAAQLPNGLKMRFERYSASGKDLIPMQFCPR